MINKNLKNKILKFFLVLLSLIFAVVVLEMIFRIYCKFNYKTVWLSPKKAPLYRYDKFTFYSHTPNIAFKDKGPEYEAVYKINFYGFRDYEFPLKKDKNEIRIFFVGDSFTYGTGKNIDKVWVKILEKYFNADCNFKTKGYKIRCINAGVGGYNTEHEFLTLKKWIDKIKPDIVVIGFLPNDIKHNYYGISSWYNFNSKGELVHGYWYGKRNFYFVSLNEYLKNPIRFLVHLKNILKDKSYFCKWLYFKYVFIKQFKLGKFGRILDEYKVKEDDKVAKGWEATDNIIRKISQFSQKKSVKLILVAIPQKIQLLMKFSSKKIENCQYNKPELKMAEICRKYKIDYFPFIDYITKNNYDIHFTIDGHLNEKGDRLLAQKFYPVLKKEVIKNFK